tara:strand:+ start:314 stop:820 length:507 start_codon:yes stop_codon:yes gene_type:complete
MTSPEINYDILVEDERWHEALPDHASLVAMSLDHILRNISSFETAKEVELSITLTNDEQIQSLNRDYREKDKPTNVLSFPQIDWENDKSAANEPLVMLGDVVIALETIQREANEQDKRLQDHFIHMLIHSVLHLCGHDHEDETDAETMENLEIQILSEMGIKNPYQTP